MATKIQVRRGLKKDLPVLDVGELGLATDTKEVYIGTSTGNVKVNGSGGGGEIILDDASLTQKGIVQLSSSITSDDETTASTPKAIKTLGENISNVIEGVYVELDSIDNGIGDKTTLLTSNKESVVGAVNELFTTVDNGKLDLRTAIIGKGGTVVGSHPNSFSELKNGVNSIKSEAKINALLKDFVINTGEVIEAGDLVRFISEKAAKVSYNFDSGNTYKTAQTPKVGFSDSSACLIGKNKVLIAYPSNNSLNLAVVSTNGFYITIEQETTIPSISYNLTKMISVATNKVLLFSQDGANIRLVTITDTNITYGTPVALNNSAVAKYLSLTLVEKNKVILTCRDGINTYGTAILINVINDVIFVENPTVFASVATSYTTSALVDVNKVVVSTSINSNTRSHVLSITDNMITVGAIATLSGSITQPSLITVDNNKALLAYSDDNKINDITIVVLTITGTSISYGAKLYLGEQEQYHPNLVQMGTNRALLVYYMGAYILNISGTTVTKGTNIASSLAYTKSDGNNLVKIDHDKVLTLSNNGSGTNTFVIKIAQGAQSAVNGLATENGVGGETKKFYDWR